MSGCASIAKNRSFPARLYLVVFVLSWGYVP